MRFLLYFPLLIHLATALDENITFEDDRVFYLPGLRHELRQKLYSGYLKVSKTRYLRYAFVESEHDPQEDPIILWLNGGPGCSSLEGLFLENGPWKVVFKGDYLEENQNSWTQFANMLYLETPVWTGFSYGRPLVDVYGSDDQTAEDNLEAVKLFFERFPHFRSNDLYLVGFSYAGVFIPTLSALLLNEEGINYQGFAIGNGLLDQNKFGSSVIQYAYGHGLIDRKQWLKMKRSCCQNQTDDGVICNLLAGTKIDSFCQSMILSNILIKAKYNGVNPYNIYNNCERTTGLADALMDKKDEFGWSFIYSALKIDRNQIASGLNAVSSCVKSEDLEAYLNKPSVREALNIPSKVAGWKACNKLVDMGHKRQYVSMRDQVLKTLKAGKRGLIYNGDADLVCNFLANNWFADDLELESVSDHRPWFYQNRISGFIREYEGLRVVTILGAGHYAIRDKPDEAFKMIRSFIFDQKLE